MSTKGVPSGTSGGVDYNKKRENGFIDWVGNFINFAFEKPKEDCPFYQ